MNNITIKNTAKIFNNEYVIKEEREDLLDTYKYLLSRSFDYFPEIIKTNEKEFYYKFIEDVKEPKEEKLLDLLNLLSLLHSKTTFFKEIDIDYYKEIYENIKNKINDTKKYYNDLMDIIDNTIYMSPSNYLLARNSTIIFNAIEYANRKIDLWYELIANKRKIRMVTIHNNATLNHYIKGTKPYLISWNKSKIDMPIYDIISVYKNHYLEFDFVEELKLYFNKYPFTEEEMILFLTILSIPEKIKYHENEYQTVTNIRKIIDYIYKTSALVEAYDLKEENIYQEKNK